jgi:hypothetical protein
VELGYKGTAKSTFSDALLHRSSVPSFPLPCGTLCGTLYGQTLLTSVVEGLKLEPEFRDFSALVPIGKLE